MLLANDALSSNLEDHFDSSDAEFQATQIEEQN